MISFTPRPLYPREKTSNHCIWGWVGPRAICMRWWDEKSQPQPVIEPMLSIPESSHYTDWATAYSENMYDLLLSLAFLLHFFSLYSIYRLTCHAVPVLITIALCNSVKQQLRNVSVESLLLRGWVFQPLQVVSCSEGACSFDPSAINMWITLKSPHMHHKGAHPLKWGTRQWTCGFSAQNKWPRLHRHGETHRTALGMRVLHWPYYVENNGRYRSDGEKRNIFSYSCSKTRHVVHFRYGL
jgi:hypothetical protein